MSKKKNDAAEPNPAPKGRGRPRTGRLSYRFVIAASAEYQTWMSEFMESIGEAEAADVWRDAMRNHAKAKGFRPPPNR